MPSSYRIVRRSALPTAQAYYFPGKSYVPGFDFDRYNRQIDTAYSLYDPTRNWVRDNLISIEDVI